MSNACEESPAEDPSTISLQESSVNPSTISLQSSPGEEVLAERGPEHEASSEVEREMSEVGPVNENEVEKSVAEGSSTVEAAAGSTPVKRFVIADSDDDITDDEDNTVRRPTSERRPFAVDHDYAASSGSNVADKLVSADNFPIIPGLSELGLVSDDFELPPEQHIPPNRLPAAHLGYDQREPNIINRSPATARDGGYRASDGQGGYLARSARTSIQTPLGYRGVQVAPERSMSHAQQQQHQSQFFVSGYNGGPVARRVVGNPPMSSPSMVQKRTAPRIISAPSQMRPQGSRLSTSAPHLTLQQQSQRQAAVAAVTAAPPVPRQADPPPHRSFHQGPDTSSHRLLLVPSGAGSRVAFSPADPSQAALANAPAPLIVSTRGTRPVVRGRGGSVAARAKKESTSGISGEETSPTHSPQATSRIPMNAPIQGSRATPISPRKQVHFSDGVAVAPGAGPGGSSSPLRMQGMPPTSLHPPSDLLHQGSGGVRSPSRLTVPRFRTPGAPAAPSVGSPAAASITSPPRVVQAAQEMPPLPENFVDDAETGSQPYTESETHKNSTLPPEVMAAATSLSAESDVNHPQWTNNDISAEDIKAKIEAISREIAQEMEQKKMESEAQAREKRRPMGDSPGSMRRRSGTESHFSGEELDTSAASTGTSRGRGRPKGSGRTRSSLSSSSSTSVAATSTAPLHQDVSEGPFGSTRSTGRASARTTSYPTTAYDGSMAPELPPPLPPMASAQAARGAHQSPNLTSPSHLSSQRDHSAHSYQQRRVNGLSPDEDLANVSTDPSSDEDEPPEEAEWGDYVTRCLCEMQHNDEWMVECEKCNVWQHMKCMGLDPKKFDQNDTYLCEICKPRPLKWTKKQAQEIQLKQLKAVSREKERKMAEKLRRREERKRAKLNQRLKEKNHAKAAKRGPAAYKKFQMISRNEYTKRAKQMLALFDTTAGAQSILDNSRDLKRGKRMFVAPDIEGLVSTEAIKQDDVIMEYVGHVCLPDECPGRLQRGALQPYCVLYNGLGQNLLCIDARRQGSDARFARRCCRSNSTLKHVLLNGCIYVMLVASERIEKGTEVTIPFDCDFRDTLVPVECACGEDPNCYMKQFNNSLRNKLSFEERPNHDIAQRAQAPNGTTSAGRKTVATPQKSKAENRGRPKGSIKKEKVTDDTPRRKGPGRKGKKVGIRLRRHSDSKNAKSSDESMERGADAEATENKEEDTTEEKKETSEVEAGSPTPAAAPAADAVSVPAPAPAPTAAAETAEVEAKTEEEEKVATEPEPQKSPKKHTEPPKSPRKQAEPPASPKKQADSPASPKKQADPPASPKKESDPPASPKKQTAPPASPKKESDAPASPKKQTAPTASPKKQNVDAGRAGSASPKKEERQTSGRRRSSTGSGRFPKREAIELKEVMDYTLPEDRNKPSREERKLQAALAAFERKEEKEKRKAEAHKDSGDAKEKRGPGRPARTSAGGSSKTGRRTSERTAEIASKVKKPEKVEKVEKVEPAAEQSVRESPRGKKKKDDSKENEVEEVSTIAQPPRKRWAAAVKENEAAQRASSPEVTSSSSATSTVDVTSPDSVHPCSVSGKKLWLRRHAAESVSEESVQTPDTAASSEPLTCAADSTSDITTSLPSRIQMSPPLKKRRHMLEACQSDEHVAATALAQMGTKAEGYRFHWNYALRCLMPNLSDGKDQDFNLNEIMRRPLPAPTPRPPPVAVAVASVSVDTTAATSTSTTQAPLISPGEVKKAKRLSLEDYKRRRGTLGSSDNSSSATSAAQSSQGATGGLADIRSRLGESAHRPTRSFIPTMDATSLENPLLRTLDVGLPMPPLGLPPDLELVKKMILQESCIPAPPVPPPLPPPPPPPPTPIETPVSVVPTSSSDTAIGLNTEAGEERMSLADRLAKEFGVCTAGAPRQSPKTVISTGPRAMSLRDVPPPPPPGPRPTTRNARW